MRNQIGQGQSRVRHVLRDWVKFWRSVSKKLTAELCFDNRYFCSFIMYLLLFIIWISS